MYKDYLNTRKNEFEADYNKIINSYPFRRLQDKTQVFPLEQHDFIRNRLTHSIEVSGIAKELGKLALEKLYNSQEENVDKIKKDDIMKATEILMCAGIVHDFGNPPFGHYGEAVIKNWFKNWFRKYENDQKKKPNRRRNYEYENEQDENQKKKKDYICKTISNFSMQMKEDLKNFDGNVQNIRILTKLNDSYKFYTSEKDEEIKKMGLNLTVALLDTIIKYPKPSYDYEKGKVNEKFGYNLAEQYIYEKIIEKTREDKEFAKNEHIKHPLTFILEAADDIAYLTADFEDAIKKKVLTVKDFIEFFKDKLKKCEPKEKLDTRKKGSMTKSPEEKLIEELENIQGNPDFTDEEVFHIWSRYVKEWFMYCCSYIFVENYYRILAGNFKESLFGEKNFHKESVNIFRETQKKFIFNEKELLKLELSSEHILNYLLDRFVDAIIMYNYEEPKKGLEGYEFSRSENKILEILPNKNKYKDECQQITKNDWENIFKEMRKDKKLKGNDKELEDAYKLYLRLLKVVDFISGMTDSYAKKLYQQLNGIY